MLNLFKRGNRTSTPSLFSSDVFPPAAPPLQQDYFLSIFQPVKVSSENVFSTVPQPVQTPYLFSSDVFPPAAPPLQQDYPLSVFQPTTYSLPRVAHSLFSSDVFPTVSQPVPQPVPQPVFQKLDKPVFPKPPSVCQQISKNWIPCIPD